MSLTFRPDQPLVFSRRDPSPADIEAATAEIKQHEAAILAIDDQVSSSLSQTNIDALRQEKTRRRERIDACKRVTALARRMPEELLIMIFQHCYDGSPSFPRRLSEVCTAWHVAASAPQFWSDIQVICSNTDAVERARYWLFKVADAPMDIQFLSRVDTSTDMQSVIDLFLPCAAQWRRLQFASINSEDVHSLFRFCTSKMLTNLLSVVIYPPFCRGHYSLESLQEILREENSPNLTYIAYHGFGPTPPTFPRHIRSLEFQSSSSLDECLVVLSNLPRLEKLTLRCSDELSPSSNPTTPLLLHNLTDLSVRGPDAFSGLIRCLVVPSLRVLCLTHTSLWVADSIEISLPAMLTASRPPLEILELDSVPLRAETLVACLRPLNELRELRLRCPRIDDATLSVLNRCEGLCPRLSRLSVTWALDIRGSTLVEVVRSRNNVDDVKTGRRGMPMDWSPIREIIVDDYSSLEEKDLAELASMTVVLDISRVPN